MRISSRVLLEGEAAWRMAVASLVEEPLGGADGERKALLNLESGVSVNKMAPSFSSLSLTLFLSFCAA